MAVHNSRNPPHTYISTAREKKIKRKPKKKNKTKDSDKDFWHSIDLAAVDALYMYYTLSLRKKKSRARIVTQYQSS